MAAGDTNVGFTPKRPAESALSTLPQPDPEKDLAALTAWSAMAKEAYSKNTQRADGAVFQLFCERAALELFPAAPMTIRGSLRIALKRVKSQPRSGAMSPRSRERT